MGSATASGPHRAPQAAEQAVASPLLEDINLAGARGVLVNITASAALKMKEVHDVMNTIKAFTAEDATVIVGHGDRRGDRRRAARDHSRHGAWASPSTAAQTKPLTRRARPAPTGGRSKWWTMRSSKAGRHRGAIANRPSKPCGSRAWKCWTSRHFCASRRTECSTALTAPTVMTQPAGACARVAGSWQ